MKIVNPVLSAIVVLLVIALDQGIKWLAELYLPLHQQIDILPFISLYRTHNTGIAFSMLSGLGAAGLAVIAIGVIAVVLVLWAKTAPEYRIARVGFALIVGGAVGNLIDRTFYGYVIDFILFHTPNWSFAIFNFADASITVGAGLVLLDELLKWRAERQENSAKKPTSPD
jgi:signal peptidase II